MTSRIFSLNQTDKTGDIKYYHIRDVPIAAGPPNDGDTLVYTLNGVFEWQPPPVGPGPTGPTGPTGPEGPGGGLPGPQGLQGVQGPQGIQGIPGEEGDQGAVGAQGPAGPAGTQGIAGNAGAQGPVGPVGPAGVQGAQGAQGPIGARGNTGAQGAQGVQGPIGATGPQGAQGPIGTTGVQGAQGLAGATGATAPPATSEWHRLVDGTTSDNQVAYLPSAPTAATDNWVLGPQSTETTPMTGGFFINATASTPGAFRFGTVTGTQWTTANRGAYSFAGGTDNTASGESSAVVSGLNNEASASRSVVFGGSYNRATNDNAAVGGGGISAGTANTASGENSAVIGGGHSTASGLRSAVVGGASSATLTGHTASSFDSVVCGGRTGNVASGSASIVFAGELNEARSSFAAVVCGMNNRASGNNSCVLCGDGNSTQGLNSSILCGNANEIKTAEMSIVVCGTGNEISNGFRNAIMNGTANVIEGGVNNLIIGSNNTIENPGNDRDASTAVGFHAISSHSNCFVVNLTTAGNELRSTNSNEFAAKAPNGFFLFTSNSAGVELAANATQWASTCDRSLKRDLREMDYADAARRFRNLPVYSYNFVGSDRKVIGTTAQQWHRLYDSELFDAPDNVSKKEEADSKRYINLLDLDSISLSVIKGLDAEIRRLELKYE